MASAAGLSEVLECSICLNVYTDPVTLSCGHNFCRKCVSEALDTQEKKTGGYSCPGCRTQFRNRPALQRNTTLHNIVENFLPTQSDQEYTGVSCSQCLHAKIPAVKCCLLCEASLCEEHLRVHNKAPEHVLCDPTASIKSRKCSIHNRILEYYCTTDSTCVCVYCLIDKHTGHQKETLNVATEKKKKKLNTDLQNLMAMKEEFEESVHSLYKGRREAQNRAHSETEEVTPLFRDLRRQIDDLEKRVLINVNRWIQYYDDAIRQMAIQKEELSRKMRHIEELCNMTDPLTVLQEPDTGDLCAPKEMAIVKELEGGVLDVASVLHKLCTISYTLSRVDTCFYLQKPADVFLDIDTAGIDLQISNDKKTATFSLHENCPQKMNAKSSRAFQCRPQVLSTQCFNSGQHYWEVDVGGSQDWKVGVCDPSMDRRGWSQSLIGYNKQSWCLEKQQSQYSLLHDGVIFQLPANFPMAKVGMFLDSETRQLSFYALSGKIRYLHTFTAVSGPLHAAFYVEGGSVKIAGGK
ncbi:E3 ubiquitin/ISG15 ligase TRIM25-like [Hyperolius riggenbachi]|uniref:E3 ubiquitin/ISG15 ligase TRIM25-like n=1 Tax=Hyperolius riggenbachi TaxID=752182 RepID=UPI0035A2D622